MFKNILVPTDLTQKSKKALDIAIGMSSAEEGAITLLHVIEVIEGAEDQDFEGFYEKLRKRAMRMIKDLAGPYEGKGRLMKTEIVIGKRVPEIIRFAHDHGTDLIVLSSHRIENFNTGEGWATISYQVGILAPCPVMMVK